MTTYIFDVETRMLADEVAAEYAGTLAGESPWSRPDLFGFACGVLVDLETGEAQRFGPEEAPEMLVALGRADVSVGYNSAAFDLPVLSAYGSVEPLWQRHVDLCSAVRDALKEVESEENVPKRLRQGGLDGLCKSNGLAGKTGVGVDAPGLYRSRRISELLDYCEDDVRLTAALYQRALESGYLIVEPTYHDAERNRVELGRRAVPVSLVPASTR